MLNESQEIPQNGKVLANVKKNNITFTITSPDALDGRDKLWLVVRSLKNTYGVRGYKLTQGDVVKLGRVKFRLKEIGPSAQETPQLEDLIEMEGEYPCRFCLSEVYTKNNPLISPCACDGTAKFIHIKCLQNWIRSKCVEKMTSTANSYYWKSLDCEVCKKPYPLQLDKQEDLIKLNKPGGNFFIMETMQRERSRIIHIVSLLNKQQVVLGRGHDSDVRISDISVSRSHALITQQASALYLEDNNSKFGTLIQIRKGINLTYNNSIAIQIGRTVVSFTLKKNPEINEISDHCSGQVPQPAQSESSEEEFVSFEEENVSLSNAK